MQYYVLAGTDGINRIVANLQRTSFQPNVTYNNRLILGLNRNLTTCTHFMPFVDTATGELMAEVSGRGLTAATWGTCHQCPC